MGIDSPRSLNELVDTLVHHDALRRDSDAFQVRTLERIAARYADETALRGLPEQLQQAISKMGIDHLYEHQAQAIESILAGNDVVIATPTASGKTLCFNVPMTVELLKHPESHALVLHPMKALTNDQRFQLERLWRSCAPSHLRSWVYDGDTPADHRAIVRNAPPQVVFTNPEMLNMSFLGSAHLWTNFLRHLRFVVIDEIHEYRGFFGSNVALLLRRFLRKLGELGAHPRVVLASATCNNPKEHARALTGRTCAVIKTSPMRPKRHFLFIAPSIDSRQFSTIYQLRIALAALACIKQGHSTIVFTPSRKFCEDVVRIAKRKATDFDLDPERIVPYRSGYTPDQRRDIEEKMRDGYYKLVFATNALEVGIDVGLLDAIILAGFPDSIMSAWQRIGRAGRSMDAEAFVLYFAMKNPFDIFMAENVDLFLNKPLDDLVVNYENEELVKRHVPCLLFEKETALKSDDRMILGEALYAQAQAAEKTYQKIATSAAAPHAKLPIRAVFSGEYKVIADGKEIGSVSEEQKLREAYLGAIYVHLGRQYRVKSHGAGEIDVVSAEANRRTVPKTWSVATETKLFDGRRFSEDASLYHGQLMIYNNFGGYREEDEISGEVVDEVNTEPIAHQKTAHAVWIEVPGDVPECEPAKVLPLLEKMIRVAVPFVVPCDRYEVSSLTSVPNRKVYIYETVPGGIGIARKVFFDPVRVLEQGLQIAEACSCEFGCPRCIALQRIPGEERVPKQGAVQLGRHLVNAIRNGHSDELDPELLGWRPLSAV